MNNNTSKTSCKRGFTLIELLVVVLIIGILAAVAVPQYQKAVEKARLVEAIIWVRTIANANRAFYLANGRYATKDEISLLDVDIPGEKITSGVDKNRIRTKHFIYSPGGNDTTSIAVAQRLDPNGGTKAFYLYILPSDVNRIRCSLVSDDGLATAIQRKLCTQINTNGTL